MMRRLLCAVLALVMIMCLLPLNAIEAKAASAMKASDEVVLYLKTMEGFTAIPRWDYVQWTVGYGNRCPDEHLQRYLEEGIPIEEADALFLEQLVYFEDQVNAFIDRNRLTFTQNQFDAVLSITYNCGAAWLTRDSDLRTAILNGTTGNTLIGIMTQWCTAGGQYLPGLMRRRLTEADMYLNGRYNTQAPEQYCYVFYDAGEGATSSLAQGYDCNLYAVPLVTPTREGYTFQGWYTAKTGGVKVTYLDENLHLATLYAHWAEGDGEYSGGSTEVPEGVMVTVTGDVVNVRSGPGTTYAVVSSVIRGQQIVITQVTTGKDGRLWGKTDKGWLCLEYTTYKEVTGDSGDSGEDDSTEDDYYHVPVYATIVGTSKVTLYNGPDTGYPKVGTLNEGDQILLVETYKMFSTWWARVETGGWICLNSNVLLHNDQMLAHSTDVTVTNSYLNVRSGPGTHYSLVTSLKKGDVIKILAVEIVNSTIWGRYSGGWVSLEYTTFDASRLDQYRYHSYGDWYETVEATCVGHGAERRDCKYCDAFETRETGYGEHSYGQWQEAVAPTCTEEGLNRRYCKYCDAYEETTVAATGHSMGQWYQTIAPTLEEYGQERRDCQHCEYYETRDVEPVEHIFTDWYVTQEPTCTETGEQRRDCTDCDYHEIQEISALGHELSQWHTVKQATCTEEGQECRECSRCTYTETRTQEAIGHSMSQWHTEREANCTQEGLQCRECENCDYSETKTLEKTEHQYCDWYISVEPTYQTPGQERRDCAVCGAYETRVKEFDGQVVTRIYATITVSSLNVRSGPGSNYGWVAYVVYGTVHEVYEQVQVGNKTWGRIDKGWICLTGYTTLKEVTEVISHTHSFGAWYTVEAPTCTATGKERRDCAGCSHYETRTLAATGHSYGAWYTVKEATASENGLERRDCACGHYETRETTYEVETVTRIYGTLTGYSFLRIRSGPGANYAQVGQLSKGDRVEIFEIVPVGNTQWGRIEQGWIQLTGYMTLEEVEEPVEHTHSYGDWYTVKEATASEKGLERRDCKHCDHYEERTTEYQGTTVKRVYATVICSVLNVRKGPGTGYALVGAVTYGTVHEVFEQVTVSGKVWGRIQQGWICLTSNTKLEEVEESTGHTHTMGGWYTTTEATCTAAGEQRRDCTGCDHYETKTVAATGHSYGEWYTVQEATASENGLERRDCRHCDHYEQRETTYQGSTVTKVYATITVSSLNVRKGPGSTYGWVGYVTYGSVYQVYEQTVVSGKVWGRIDGGWICLTGYTTLEEVVEPANKENASNKMTVTASILNVRAGAGTGYNIVTSLAYGTQVTVLETKVVNGVTWARIEQGWVSMAYLA